MTNDLQFKWDESKRKLSDYIIFNNIDLKYVSLSFSGGKDSMVMLELIKELGWVDKIKIVFSNTLMEYDAMLEFIKELKEIDKIPIIEINDAIPQPIIYAKYGHPIHSKMTSHHLAELQRIHFDFQNDTFNSWQVNYEKYGGNKGKAQFRWLDGDFPNSCPKYLRKKLAEIDFKVSNVCCTYSKKKPLIEFAITNGIKLSLIGVRKDEGGVRAFALKSCINMNKEVPEYYPLLFFKNEEITQIVEEKQIKLSKCYTLYGLKRTGCFCCPFDSNWPRNLEILKKYEPSKYKATLKMFAHVFKIQERRKPENIPENEKY